MTTLLLIAAMFAASPAPTGRLVTVGSHVIHLDCRGAGLPVVVIEVGLGDFSFDWLRVTDVVARRQRVCAYDRAGYAWSTAGPMPRTFDQLNLELKTALGQAGERGPFILVGHSFGGPAVRNFAERYPDLVAGMVLVDGVHEDQRVMIAGQLVALRGSARNRPIPEPTLADSVARETAAAPAAPKPLPEEFRVLPATVQALHQWASSLGALAAAEDSQRDWSAEYFARWHDHPQTGLLGAKPLVVLARQGDDSELARERIVLQVSQGSLSSNSVVLFAGHDHNMQLSIPRTVAQAIFMASAAHRLGKPLAELGVDWH